MIPFVCVQIDKNHDINNVEVVGPREYNTDIIYM